MRAFLLIGAATCALGSAACGSDTGTGGSAVPSCGDLACNGSETCATCAGDCGACNVAYCGNGACDGDEFCGTCAGDCGACPGEGCGDDACAGDETCRNCPGDCGACPTAVCGDGACAATTESCASCDADCGACPVLCGGVVCKAGLDCVDGHCQAPCASSCDGKVCGDDGCGGSCGTCASGSCVDGRCEIACAAQCDGKTCGDDGCGGSCGTCASGSCVAGRCQTADPCGGVPEAGCCTADHGVRRCIDGEVVTESCASAAAVCTWREDDETFQCDLALQPTRDGVATLCPGETCGDTCAGKSCGSACGTSCGTCPEGSYCAGTECVDDPCLGISFVGCCFGGFGLYCGSDGIEILDCAADQPCGWDVGSPENGYTCNGVGVDPSGEADYFCPMFPAALAGAPTAGELIVSEIMANPAVVDDSDGEWFEVMNRSRRVLDLKGLVIEGAAGESFVVPATIYLPPGIAALFAKKGRADNGGMQADVTFGASLSLTNGGDVITLRSNGVIVDSVAFDASWGIASGVAIALRGAAIASGDNDGAAAWCAARTVAASGDKGTPRGPNDCD